MPCQQGRSHWSSASGQPRPRTLAGSSRDWPPLTTKHAKKLPALSRTRDYGPCHCCTAEGTSLQLKHKIDYQPTCRQLTHTHVRTRMPRPNWTKDTQEPSQKQPKTRTNKHQYLPVSARNFRTAKRGRVIASLKTWVSMLAMFDVSALVFARWTPKYAPRSSHRSTNSALSVDNSRNWLTPPRTN